MPLEKLNGKAKPFRTSGGKAANFPGVYAPDDCEAFLEDE